LASGGQRYGKSEITGQSPTFVPMINIRLSIGMLFLLAAASMRAQSSRQILVRNANSLEFNDRYSGAQRLIGDVIFEHEGTLLYCDSAYLYDQTNRLEAFSNVRIVSDSATITGERLLYDGKTRIADISGKTVRLIDPGTRLTTDRLSFDTGKNLASYVNGGKIESSKSKNVLQSLKGQYNSREKAFYFQTGVSIRNPEYTLYSDTLKYVTTNETAWFYGPTRILTETDSIYCELGFYNLKSGNSRFEKNASIHSEGRSVRAGEILYKERTGEAQAKNHVRIVDTTENVIISGNLALYNDKTGQMMVTDSALLEQKFSGDTLYLHADSLFSSTDQVSKNKLLRAFRQVKFYMKDFQGKCDSLSYSERDSLMELFGRPVIWNNENQLTGDSIRIQMANQEMRTLILRNSGFIASIEDSLNFNQIKGKHITGHFTQGKLQTIEVQGNGQSVYYAKNDAGEYIGVNKADCSNILIQIDSNKVKSISFLNKPDATLYPANELGYNELRLRGFNWYGMMRPLNKHDVFLWQEPIIAEKPNKRKRRL
jgi:lipopolysaccharide export system protein LptA